MEGTLILHLAIALRKKWRSHVIITTSNIGREEILSRDTVHMMYIISDTTETSVIFPIASKAISESTRPWCRHDPVGMLMMELIWWLHDTFDWVN